MDIRRELELVDAFLATPFGPRFRSVNRRWWVLAEDGWTQRMATEQLQRAVLDTARVLWERVNQEALRQAGMSHQQKRIMSMLAGRLHDDHLPGPHNPLELPS